MDPQIVEIEPSGQVLETPYLLRQSVRLTGDLHFAGSAFIFAGNDITLDLNGSTVFFNESGADHRYGAGCPPWWNDNPRPRWADSDIFVWERVSGARIVNGIIAQVGSGKECAGVLAYKTAGIEINNVGVCIKGDDTHAICLNQCDGIDVQDNTIDDQTTVVTNRHQGRAAIDIYYAVGDPLVVGNTILGCSQWGIRITRADDEMETVTVSQNIIKPDGVCTNGYGIGVHGRNVDVHNNTITATTAGMGIHLNDDCDGSRVFGNTIDITCQPVWGEYPRMNAHGIALERCTNTEVFDNDVISRGLWNIENAASNGCALKIGVNPGSGNRVHDNRFRAIHGLGALFERHPLYYATTIYVEEWGANGVEVYDNEFTTNDCLMQLSSWIGEGGEQVDASGFVFRDNMCLREDRDETTN